MLEQRFLAAATPSELVVVENTMRRCANDVCDSRAVCCASAVDERWAVCGLARCWCVRCGGEEERLGGRRHVCVHSVTRQDECEREDERNNLCMFSVCHLCGVCFALFYFVVTLFHNETLYEEKDEPIFEIG